MRIILLILNLIKLPQIPPFPLLARSNSTAYFNSPGKNSVENGISGRFVREFRFAPENCSFTLKFRCFTREFHAFTREFRRFTREFHAFTREFRRFTREFRAFTRECYPFMGNMLKVFDIVIPY
ncbi:hypothetical protein ACV242_005029 [Peribacillus simplex]